MFSEDNKTFYVSCMGTQNVLLGDAVADKPLRTVALDKRVIALSPSTVCAVACVLMGSLR